MTMNPLPCTNCIHAKVCSRKDEIELIGQNMLEDYKDTSNWVSITISCNEFCRDKPMFDNIRRNADFS